MASQLDHSVGIGAETTYGTAVTPTRWYEWSPDSTLSWDPQYIQGGGLRVGTFLDRGQRRRNGYGRGELTIRAQLTSRTFGLLLRAAMGAGTSTLVSGATYQQLFTFGTVGASLPPLTIQCGIVDSNGTVRPHTFAGCVAMSWALEIPDDGGPAMVEVTFDARTLDTVTAITAPVMPTQTATSPVDFRSRDITGFTLGGSLTMPTANALATGGTAAAYFRSLRIKVDNNLATDRTVMGNRLIPTAGRRSATISATAEYTDTVLTDAFISQSDLPLSATFAGPETLSTGTATLQIAASAMKINSGPVPTPTDGTPVQFDFEGQILDNGSGAQALAVVLRTADTAL